MASTNPTSIWNASDSGSAVRDTFNFNLRRRHAHEFESISATTDTIADHPTDNRSLILMDGGSNAVTITLPTLADNLGRVITFLAEDGTNTLTLDGEGAETITDSAGAATTKTLSATGKYKTVLGTTSTWWVIAEN